MKSPKCIKIGKAHIFVRHLLFHSINPNPKLDKFLPLWTTQISVLFYYYSEKLSSTDSWAYLYIHAAAHLFAHVLDHLEELDKVL